MVDFIMVLKKAEEIAKNNNNNEFYVALRRAEDIINPDKDNKDKKDESKSI